MINFSLQNESILNQYSYIVKTFSRIYQITNSIYLNKNLPDFNHDAILISYGSDIPFWQGNHIHIYESSFYSEKNYLKKSSMPLTPLLCYNNLPILYLGISETKDPFIKVESNKIITNIDIISSSFFLLTRYEEAINNDTKILDNHDRFSSTASIAYKNNFLNRPLVNEYFELLWNCIRLFYPRLQRQGPWGGKDFALCLTHDIDCLQKYTLMNELLTLGSLVLKQRNPYKAISRFMDYIQVATHKKSDPFDNFDQILFLESRYGASSSFYFMTEPDYSGGYHLNGKKTLRIIEKLKSSNAEIGLHAGYYSYNNNDVLQRQKDKMTDIVNINRPGCRQHFLRWKAPDTWRIQEKCGIAYDSTLGYADHEGFRAGICHPFQPYDLYEDRTLDLWEIPLTIMDGTLSKYRGLNPEDAARIIEYYIDTVQRYAGVMVVLWHNTFFDPDSYPGWENFYEKILSYAINKNGLLTNGQTIIDLYSNRMRPRTIT